MPVVNVRKSSNASLSTRNGATDSLPRTNAVPKKQPKSEHPTELSLDAKSIALADVEFIRLPEVKAVTGLGKTSIYEMIRTGSFPAPVRVAPRAVAWIRAEIRQWAIDRVQASRSAA
jgi:predicted DNA-binding transcriptional regulator AlpA